jgi:hypothetical protein
VRSEGFGSDFRFVPTLKGAENWGIDGEW